MHTIWRVLLIYAHLAYSKEYAAAAEDANGRELLKGTAAVVAPTVEVGIADKAKFVDLSDDGEDAEIVEARVLPDTTAFPSLTPAPNEEKQKREARSGRQLFYDPNLLYLPSFGVEGGKCITTRGVPGVCMRIGHCPQYFSVGQQVNFYTLRQWPQSATLGSELCNFYDQFGRANSGICCTHGFDLAGGGFGGFTPGFVPVQPIPPPPPAAAPAPEPPREDADDDNVEHINTELESEFDADQDIPDSPDFLDENGPIYDPIGEDNVDRTSLSPVTYDDYRYQWPSQFGGGQWPPALPTHPPSMANWPPPIPTHPPNHHYPTHPPSSSAGSRPTRPPSQQTTKKPAATTTRRPTSRPSTTTTRRSSYPGYPSYPSYPSYPTYRPITTTTTTTRRPVSSPGGGGPAGGSNALGLPQQCGNKNPMLPDQERIVGGMNASPHEFPWIAVLFRAGKQFCGGSLITPNHILTAAHCVSRMTSWDVAALTAHLSDYNIRTDFEVKHVERRIKRLVRHKGFDFSHLHNDIAILTINEPVKFTYEIQPICLPTSSTQQGRSYSGQLATVAGWGSLRENGPQPSILQKVQIPIWSNSECARKYGRAAPGGIIESMICAGQASKDSCSGDSGGPLIVNEGGRYTQVGIVSWGIGCGKGEYPGVYTRITALLPWIYKNIKM